MTHSARMRFLKAMIALSLLLGATNAVRAQGQTLPPNTVLGRTGISPGPAQAIPFATFGAAIAPFVVVLLPFAPIVGAVRSSSAPTVALSTTTDYFLCLDPTSNAIAVNLPASPTTGLTYLIKDCTGQSGTHNITVTPAAGNIDGAASFIMNFAYQSIGLTYTGAQWSLN